MGLLEERKKNIVNDLNSIATKDKLIIDYLSSLSYSGYYYYAMVGLNRINTLEVKQYCNKGVETINYMFDIYFNRVSVDLEHRNEIVYFPTDVFYNMLFCSQNVTNYTKFAQNFIEYDEKIRHKRGGKIYDWPELFLALSHLVLGEDEQCKYRLDQAALDKKPTGQLKGYSEIIRGIFQNEVSIVYEGIEKQLKWFKKSSQSSYHSDFPYNFPVMGFINFARYKGLEIHIDSPHVHPDMIAPLSENFVFEGIPEVYEVIEKAKRKNTGVLGKLKNLFG